MFSKKSFTHMPDLSELEKLTIDAQNSIIKQVFQDKFQIPVHEISRDKEGHIYVFLLRSSDIEAYTLAYNTDENIFTDYRVGDLGYTFRDSTGRVDLLCIHRAFFNKGLGTLLLQVFENLSISHKAKSMQLDGVKTFLDTSPNHRDISEILDQMDKQEGKEYIRKNFHDVNFYFYSSYGFTKVRETLRCTKMKKTNLKNICVIYGLEKNPVKNKGKYLPDMTKSLGKDSFQSTAVSTQKKDYFFYDNHTAPSERMYPLRIKPTYGDFRLLYEILTTSKSCKNPSYSGMRSNMGYYNNSYYDKYQTLEEFYKRVYNSNKEMKTKCSLSSKTLDKMESIMDKYIELYSKYNLKKSSLNFELGTEPNI